MIRCFLSAWNMLMSNNVREIGLILKNPLGAILEGFCQYLTYLNIPEDGLILIAKAHDINIDAARKLYYAGVQKVLRVIIEMDAVKKQTPEERKKAGVAKSKRYLEKNRDKVNDRRRAHYAKNKERINAKRRKQHTKKMGRNSPPLTD